MIFIAIIRFFNSRYKSSVTWEFYPQPFDYCYVTLQAWNKDVLEQSSFTWEVSSNTQVCALFSAVKHIWAPTEAKLNLSFTYTLMFFLVSAFWLFVLLHVLPAELIFQLTMKCDSELSNAYCIQCYAKIFLVEKKSVFRGIRAHDPSICAQMLSKLKWWVRNKDYLLQSMATWEVGFKSTTACLVGSSWAS